jgi:hypothetical protein
VKRLVFLGLSLLLLVVGQSSQATPLAPLREVNAPYFSDGLHFDETAVFWLGRVTPHENYADVRVGYVPWAFWVHVNVMDEYLWYDTSPSPGTLTDWDAVTLYLDKRSSPGNVPTSDSYRFDGQLNAGEPRDRWQAAYLGDGASWTSIPITFTTYNTSYGDVPPNVVGYHQGWFIAFSIPFANLGLSGSPPQGTVWRLGIRLHDRDAATGPVEPDKSWPENMVPDQPSSWGILRFGLPSYVMSTPVGRQGTTIVRQGLNGAVVQDGVVGGNTLCGGDVNDYFQQWGNLNYAHDTVLNVQNVEHISEWPCFSKAYITFPLTAMPAGKTVISATLTLYHRGNPGPAPEPAYIQVLTVNEDWNEATLTWNNAPLARENLGGVWIASVPVAPPDPGIPYNWDVSRAVAEAYTAGQPLRLALYAASGPFHNGRYFHSSDVDDYNAIARPTLTIAWGSATPTLHVAAHPPRARIGDHITYTLSLIGSGYSMTLTDELPQLMSAPGTITTIGGGTTIYQPLQHQVTWQGTITSGMPVTITFPVTVTTSTPCALINIGTLIDAVNGMTSNTAVVIANGVDVWLPLLMK